MLNRLGGPYLRLNVYLLSWKIGVGSNPCTLSFLLPLQASYSNSLIAEGSEPENFFWVALGGRGDYDKVGIAMNDLNSRVGVLGSSSQSPFILGKGF